MIKSKWFVGLGLLTASLIAGQVSYAAGSTESAGQCYNSDSSTLSGDYVCYKVSGTTYWLQAGGMRSNCPSGTSNEQSCETGSPSDNANTTPVGQGDSENGYSAVSGAYCDS